MAKACILVVEDEADIQELIEYNMTRNGYRVICASTGEAAIQTAKASPPDLILLDLMLPGIDGTQVCRQLRNDEKTQHIPIIMLTAKSEDADIVSGLELGADDYITKPFSPRVLLARVRAVLRRKATPQTAQGDVIRIHDVTVHVGRHEVRVHDRLVNLTYTEFRILELLSRRPGWVFTRYQIVDEIRGADYPVTDRSVDVHIVSLRKKLGEAGRYLETVRGVGYRMREAD